MWITARARFSFLKLLGGGGGELVALEIMEIISWTIRDMWSQLEQQFFHEMGGGGAKL